MRSQRTVVGHRTAQLAPDDEQPAHPIGTDDHGHRRELIALVETAKRLSPSAEIAR